MLPDSDIIERARTISSEINAKFDSIEYESPIVQYNASAQFEILKQQIMDFQKSMDADSNVVLLLTNFGHSILMQVTQITYRDPVLIIFKGFVNNKEATLIQHVNQLNFLLTSTPRLSEEPKIKIGFGD